MAAAIRILYVDDEPDLLGIGKLFLEQSVDFTVTTALSGPDAFRLLEQEKFDAIISDYQMPGMDGIQFLVEVRTRFGQIPFILFTGRGREEIVIQAINSGADFYLQKGGDPGAQFAELSHKVRQAISRFNAEKQIKQSEEKFSTAFTISPDPLAITDLKSGTIINANPAFSAWSGYSSDELIGKTTKELDFWANTHDRDEIVTALQAHENIIDKVIELRIKNGDIRNCQFSARILSIDGNDYLFTRSRDITDQILASQVLQQSEERFRAIFANQQNGIVIIDPSDHRIVDVNPYISNLVGLPKEQIIGKVCHVFICPAQWGKCPITDLGQCVDNSERVLIAADGRKIPIIKTVVPIEFGQKNYLIENIHDITESKKAEDTLRESEARYRLISENTADVIWTLDYKTGKFTYVSPSVQKLRGYTPDEVLNQTMAEALTTDSMEAVARLIQERISKRKPGDTSRVISTNLADQPCKDGSVVSTEVVSTMIFDEQGHPVEIIGISRNITERKLAEAALHESEEKYRRLFELEADAILLVDKETGNLIEANRVAESLYGYSREEFLRMKNTELSAEPDETRRATQDAQTHIPVRYHRKKDGTIFPVEITVNILHWQGRQVHLAAIRDITERKLAEDALRESEENFRSIFENNSAAMAIIEPDTTISRVNKEYCNLSGYTKQEVIGMSWTKQIPPEDLERLKEFNRRRLINPNDAPDKYEFTFYKKNGEIKHTLMSIVMIQSKKMIASFIDITERKRVEEALHESESFNRNIVENLHDYIVLYGSDGKIISINPAAERGLGYNAEEVVGTSVLSYVAPECRDEVTANITVRRDGGDTPLYETVLITHDGQRRTVLAKGTQVPYHDVTATLLLLIDITVRKQMEEALQERQALLTQAEKLGKLGGWEFDIDTQRLTWTEMVYEIHELDITNRLMVENGINFYSPASRPIIEQAVQRAIDQNEPFDVDLEIITAKGNLRNVHAVGKANLARRTVSGFIQDITERKRAENALRESHDRFEATIASLDDAVFLVDPATRLILQCNDATTRIFGYSREELVGRGTGFLHVDQAHLEQFGREAGATYEDPGYYKREFQMRRKDGCVFPTEHFVRPIHDPDGRILYVVSVVRDITERKRAEETLRNAHERLRCFVDANIIGIILASPSGEIIETNDYYLNIIGYTREEFDKGMVDWRAITPPEWLPADERAIEELRKLGKCTPYEKEYLRRDGTRVSVSISDALLPGPEEHIAAFIVDITERKRAEDQLLFSERKFAAAFQASPDPIAITEIQTGKILDINQAFENWSGYLRQEITGKTTRDLNIWVYPEERDSFVKILNTQGFVHKKEVTGRIRGEFRNILFSAKVLETGDNAYMLSLAEDITERKRAEEILRESEARFRKILEMAPLPLCYVNMNGVITFRNERFVQIFGYTADDVPTLAEWWQQAYPDAHYRQWVTTTWDAAVKRATEHGIDINPVEYTVTCKSGEERIIEITGIMLGDDFLATFIDLTERKRAEEALRENEQMVSAIVESSQDWIWAIDRNGRHTYSNRAVESILGYSPAELQGLGLDLVHPDDKPLVEAEWPGWVEERRGWRNKVLRWRAKDGAYRHLESTAAPILDPRGELLGFRGVDRDITERKRAEDALRIKDTVFESSIAANSIADNQGIITSVNPAFLLIWGYQTKEDAIGKSIVSFFAHEKDAVPVLEALDTFGRWEGEFTAMRVDSSTFIAFGIATVIRDETGKQIGYQSTLLDITERKRAEEELRAAYEQLTAQKEELRAQYDMLALTEAEWESTFNAISDWITLITPDGRILRTNKAAESLFGAPTGQVLGLNCFELVHGAECPNDRCPRKRMLVSKKRETTEIPMQGGNGWLQVTVDPILNSAGDVVSAVHIVRDISERMRSQKAMVQAKKKLNLLNYVTFSDIQNMIFSLSGYQHLAKEMVKEGAAGTIIGKQEEILQKISHSLKFAQSFQDLGLKPPQWQTVNHVFLLAISHLDFLKINHTVQLDGLEIFADPLLEQVFQIIADNTLTHGMTATHVTLRYAEGPESVTLFFEDDGAGIPADTKEKIFLPDFQKKKGVGLFLAREILDITGITIKETGEPGKGARFEMAVPKGAYRFQEIR